MFQPFSLPEIVLRKLELECYEVLLQLRVHIRFDVINYRTRGSWDTVSDRQTDTLNIFNIHFIDRLTNIFIENTRTLYYDTVR